MILTSIQVIHLLLLNLCELSTHRIDGLLVSLNSTGVLKNCGSSNHHINSSLSNFSDVINLNSSINLETAVNSSIVDHLTSFSCLVQSTRDESLSPESRVYRHKKDDVKLVHNVLSVVKGSSGAENKSSLASSCLNKLKRSINVVACLRVEGDVTGTCIDKVSNDSINGGNHEMNINRSSYSVVAKSLAYHGSNGEVRNVVVVHNIEVNNVSSSLKHIVYFFSKPCEISRKDGRSNEVVLISPYHVECGGGASYGGSDPESRCRRYKRSGGKEGKFHDRQMLEKWN
mmetsp:Transcript_21268/g.31490  ORF Transcript_21268/g.31490 Transcript_21268/m.31490 type:complete len:286 (-) Transcript_21268:23-880(-)